MVSARKAVKFLCWTMLPGLICGALIGCKSWSNDNIQVYRFIVPPIYYGCICILTLAPIFFRFYVILTLELGALSFFTMMLLLCICTGWLDIVTQETALDDSDSPHDLATTISTFVFVLVIFYFHKRVAESAPLPVTFDSDQPQHYPKREPPTQPPFPDSHSPPPIDPETHTMTREELQKNSSDPSALPPTVPFPDNNRLTPPKEEYALLVEPILDDEEYIRQNATYTQTPSPGPPQTLGPAPPPPPPPLENNPALSDFPSMRIVMPTTPLSPITA